MKAYWRFLKSVVKHKWYVLVAGRRLKVPLWRLLVHDLSKLTPAEFGPYARHFYADASKKGDPRDFDAAWHFHKLRNSHHWEWWVSVEGNMQMRVFDTPSGPVMVHEDKKGPIPQYPANALRITVPSVLVLPMPMVCVREMVADWFAAGRAYNGAWPDPTNYTWFKVNRPRMHLHPTTEVSIATVLTEAAQWEWK